jgi:hypothetical protein
VPGPALRDRPYTFKGNGKGAQLKLAATNS